MIGQGPNAHGDAPAVSGKLRPGEDAERAPQGDLQGRPPEIGGREGPEPTRFGDWEKNGRCIDF